MEAEAAEAAERVNRLKTDREAVESNNSSRKGFLCASTILGFGGIWLIYNADVAGFGYFVAIIGGILALVTIQAHFAYHRAIRQRDEYIAELLAKRPWRRIVERANEEANEVLRKYEQENKAD